LLRTLRHNTRRRGLQRACSSRLRGGGRFGATCAGRFCGRGPHRRGFNRPRTAAQCPQ